MRSRRVMASTKQDNFSSVLCCTGLSWTLPACASAYDRAPALGPQPYAALTNSGSQRMRHINCASVINPSHKSFLVSVISLSPLLNICFYLPITLDLWIKIRISALSERRHSWASQPRVVSRRSRPGVPEAAKRDFASHAKVQL